jgi:hypothetical protein
MATSSSWTPQIASASKVNLLRNFLFRSQTVFYLLFFFEIQISITDLFLFRGLALFSFSDRKRLVSFWKFRLAELVCDPVVLPSSSWKRSSVCV